MSRAPASQPAPDWTVKGRLYRACRVCRGSGFSLLEIIVVLAILSVLAVVAMPTVTSMMRESEMREPAERLQELAKGARLSAMLEGYPYEIIFTAEGFEARRFQLRSDEEQGQEEEEETGEKSDGQDGDEYEAESGDETAEDENGDRDPHLDGEEEEEPPKLHLPELEAYRFAETMSCRLLFWGRTRWSEPSVETEKERIAVNDRWIFQPSGLCNPLRVQFYRGDDWIELAFNPLTADLQSERSFIAD